MHHDEDASSSSNQPREDPTNLLKSALAMFEDDYQKRNHALEQRERDFQLLLLRVEEAHAKIGDRVRLNLRGEIFEVPKAILLRFPGTFFSCLLASTTSPTTSPSELSNDAEKAVTYYVDRSPIAFHHVIDYLSSGEDLYLDGETPATVRAVLEHLDFFHLPFPLHGVFSQWYPNFAVSSSYFRVSGHHFWLAFCSRELSPNMMKFTIMNVAECPAWIRLGLVKKRLCRSEKDLAIQLGTAGDTYTIQVNSEGVFTDVGDDDEKGSQEGALAEITGANVVVEYRLICHRGVPFKVRFIIDNDANKSTEFRIAKTADSELVFALCTNAPSGAVNLLDLSFEPHEEEFDEEDEADDDKEQEAEEHQGERQDEENEDEGDDDDLEGDGSVRDGSSDTD